MSRWVPRVYGAARYDYTNVFEPDFCRRFNGLMLRAGERVRPVGPAPVAATPSACAWARLPVTGLILSQFPSRHAYQAFVESYDEEHVKKIDHLLCDED